MAGAAERARRRNQRALSKTTLSTAKLAASLGSRKKSNDQSNSSSRRNSAKLVSGSIEPAAQPDGIPKPVAQAVGGFADSPTQPGEESAGPIESIEPMPSDSKLHTSRSPSPTRPPNFVSESPLGIRADEEPENSKKYRQYLREKAAGKLPVRATHSTAPSSSSRRRKREMLEPDISDDSPDTETDSEPTERDIARREKRAKRNDRKAVRRARAQEAIDNGRYSRSLSYASGDFRTRNGSTAETATVDRDTQSIHAADAGASTTPTPTGAKAAAKDTTNSRLSSREPKADAEQDYMKPKKQALDNLDEELMRFADEAIEDNRLEDQQYDNDQADAHMPNEPHKIIFPPRLAEKEPDTSSGKSNPKAKSTPKSDAGPSNAGDDPPNAGTSPPNAGAGPSNADAGPSNADAGPSNADAGPSNANAGPSNSGAGPSNADAGPSNAGARPSNAGPSTSRGKAAKTIAGTSRKAPVTKKKPKVVRYNGQIDKENHLHLPTIKAKRNGTFLYKKRPGTRRLKPGYGALKEIRHYQKAETLLIPAAPFGRLVRDVALQVKPDVRFQRSAMVALQEASESILTNELAMANLAAIHAKRVTIQQKDMELIKNLRVMITGRALGQ